MAERPNKVGTSIDGLQKSSCNTREHTPFRQEQGQVSLNLRLLHHSVSHQKIYCIKNLSGVGMRHDGSRELVSTCGD